MNLRCRSTKEYQLVGRDKLAGISADITQIPCWGNVMVIATSFSQRWGYEKAPSFRMNIQPPSSGSTLNLVAAWSINKQGFKDIIGFCFKIISQIRGKFVKENACHVMYILLLWRHTVTCSDRSSHWTRPQHSPRQCLSIGPQVLVTSMQCTLPQP